MFDFSNSFDAFKSNLGKTADPADVSSKIIERTPHATFLLLVPEIAKMVFGGVTLALP